MPAEEMPTFGRHFFRGLEGAQLEGIPLVIKMAANISVRELPSPEKVLTSLKSSGTFDRFRKSCMASIELDPVYLRHAEDLRQSGEDYLTKDSRASSTTKNEMRNELRGHIIKELSKSHVQKKLEDMITDVINKREDEISGVISDAVQKLTKAEGSAESLNSNPSSSQVALPSHSPTKEAPKETALELLDAFGVSVSDVKKKGSKEAVASGKAKPPIPSEPRRVLSGGKHKGVAAQLSQVRPLPEAEPALDDKETGSSKFTSRRLHHLRLSSSDESGNGDGEESDSQPPLGEAQLQSSHASVKPSRERKELGLALQLQATKKLSRPKMESQHVPTVPPTTKPAMAESKDSPDNTHLPVGGSHHLSRHLLKRPFSSTEVTSKDGCSTQGQAKRQKCAHEDASGEECMAETEQVRFGDSSKRRAKDDTFMVTRSQLRKTQNN